jgi:hypothetical protein
MPLQPLPQAVLTAHKLRQQAKELLLLADELEASAPAIKQGGDGVYRFGKVEKKRRRKCSES